MGIGDRAAVSRSVPAELAAELQRASAERRGLRQQVIARTEQLFAAREDVRALDRLKQDFVTLVAHELRTPLTSVVGMADLILSGVYEDHDDLLDMVGTISAEGSRLSRFVTDAIEYLQWASGDVTLNADVFDLSAQVAEAVQNVQAAHAEKRVRAVVDLPDSVEAYGDLSTLRRAFERVLDNAFKFSPEGGTVETRLRVTPLAGAEEWVVLTIRDYGVGIDADQLADIFRAMSLCYATRHHTRGGGLSLAIVREVVRRHRGTVRVESDGVGQGCTGTIGLPRWPAGGRPPAPAD